MYFKRYDALRLFVETAKFSSFSEAADILNMTKGAISYQIKTLENDLGIRLFDRNSRGVSLSQSGQDLLETCRTDFEDIEAKLLQLQKPAPQTLTIGMSTYFASRWLSPRLMTFMQMYPEIQLRIQPIVNPFDLKSQGIDLAIRWGNGCWSDVEIEQFLPCPAWPVGNHEAAEKVNNLGLEKAFKNFTLLRDHDDSNAWSDWFGVAKLTENTRSDTLIIPDPNVRVQAVIDGQGIALNDILVEEEIGKGTLFRLSKYELTDYGYYLAFPEGAKATPAVMAFNNWLQKNR